MNIGLGYVTPKAIGEKGYPMNIIHQDGKRYAPTGERRPPKKGEWYKPFADSDCLYRYFGKCYLAHDYDIYRELPDEPKKTTKDPDTMEAAAKDSQEMLDRIAAMIPDEAYRRLHSMVAIARAIEEYSHEIAGYVTESFKDSDGSTWARGPSAVSHAAKDYMRRLWREIKVPSPEPVITSPAESRDTVDGTINTTKNFAEVIRAKMDADPELKEAIEEERERMRLERDHDETLLNALSLAKENDELKAEIRRLEGIIEGIARKLEELKNGK